MIITSYRGVLLYAIVMGYLPFGDDNQIINRLCNYHHVPMEGNQISEGKSILVLIYNHIIVLIFPSEYEQLVRSLLIVDVTARPLIAEILSHMWMTSFPSVRPSWEGPCGGKHTVQNSLPSIFHSVDSSTRCYDVEVHSSRLPSNDQQDTMNAMDTTDAETALPLRDSSSGSEVQEEHLIPANNTVLSASVSCSEEQDCHPLNPATNCPSLADEQAVSNELKLINKPLPESGASTTQLVKSASLTSVKQDSLTPDEGGKTIPAKSDSSTSEELDHHLSLSTNATLPAKFVASNSMKQNRHLCTSNTLTTNKTLPATSLSLTTIKQDSYHIHSTATTTQPTKSLSSTSMKQDIPSYTKVPGQSISSTSIKQNPSGPVLPEPEISPVLELDYSLRSADNINQPASNTTTPAVHRETSTDARSRQKQRKRCNLITRLQSAVSRRIFSSLRKKFNVL